MNEVANTQQLEEDTQQLNQSVYCDKKNEFINQTNELPSTFNYGSFELMKKQLFQEQLEQEKKNRIALEMRHS